MEIHPEYDENQMYEEEYEDQNIYDENGNIQEMGLPVIDEEEPSYKR